MDAEAQQQRLGAKRAPGDTALRIRVSSWSSAPTSATDDGVDESPGSGSASSPSEAKGESAAPSRGAKRRRRATDAPSSSASSFLAKTYEMLERCPAELAAWTPRGESFVVKQPDAFAERVIPAYFKHSTFSSFVRQLSLYGFRKVRGVDAAADGDDDDDGTEDARGWVEFRHDKFVRGQRELLRAIKRRSAAASDGPETPSPSVASVATTASASVSSIAAFTPVDRAEFDAMRTEMRGLRDQVQQLNKHVAAVMQLLAAGRPLPDAERAARPPPPPPPSGVPTTPGYSSASQASGTPGGIAGKQQFAAQTPLSIYAPPAPSLTISTSASGLPAHVLSAHESLFPSPRHDVKAMRSPVGTYHLRPLQSLIHASVGSSGGGPGTPVGIPPLPSPRPSPMPLASPRLAFLSHAASAFPPVSTPESGGSSGAPRHSEWEAYARQQQRFTRALPSPGRSATSPDVAVRQLSQVAAQTRSDLLSCIVARIIGFLRVQQQRQQQQQSQQSSTPRSTPRSGPSASDSSQEVEGVADAVNSDIALKLAWARESPAGASPLAAASPGSDVLLDAETAAMYRVEILKFISRELPRALNDAVEKRLAPAQKKALNRSLLALLVQKAQAALEHQMRATPSPSGASAS